MPAPHRRSRGASLAVADNNVRARTPRERLVASREQAGRRHARTLPDGRAEAARPSGSQPALDRRAWEWTLAVPCSRHSAQPGEPCWAAPRALCGARQHRKEAR